MDDDSNTYTSISKLEKYKLMQENVDSWCNDLDIATRTIPNIYMNIVRFKNMNTLTINQQNQLKNSIDRLNNALRTLNYFNKDIDKDDIFGLKYFK